MNTYMVIMKRVCKHIVFINELAKAKTKQQRQRILHFATPEQLKVIHEIAVNTCKGNVPLSKQELSKLKRHKKHIHHVYKKPPTKKYLSQNGGFLPLLLPIIAKLAGSVLGAITQ